MTAHAGARAMPHANPPHAHIPQADQMAAMRRVIRKAGLMLALLLPVVVSAAGPARAQDTAKPADATSALLLDFTTGTLLADRNANLRFQPGSSAKLMTAVIAFDALAAGEITQEQAFPVSEHAWRTGGAPARVTTMFARLKSDVPVIDLLRGLLIQNANDAAIVLAEGMAGSEEAFAARMNARAAELGMTDTRFANPTGYEAASAHTSARDLAHLAAYVLSRHTPYYTLFSAPDFTWNGIFQRNKNPLLAEIPGLDGLVAGYSETSGFNGIGSVLRGSRRLVGVVAGHKTSDDRRDALRDLFDSLEKDYEEVVLYAAGDAVTQARVFGGTASQVPLRVDRSVEILLPRGDRHDYHLRAVYEGPLSAPVERGREVGEFRVLRGETVVYRAPLVTAGTVERGTVTGRARDVLRETLFGWWLDEG